MSCPELNLEELGDKVLVVAPHPDDESLGCGGLIARLRRRDVTISVLLVSDGSMSHPGSTRFPASARRVLRESEMRAALACLAVGGDALYRLDCIDGGVPMPGEAGFEAAVATLRRLLEALDPETVVAPWRRDPHRDHRASGAIVRDACRHGLSRPRLLEYAVWLEERGAADDWPRTDEARIHRIDVTAVREQKALAIAAHASQHGRVIVDDPSGFTLAPTLVSRLLHSAETFFEVREAPELPPGPLQ